VLRRREPLLITAGAVPSASPSIVPSFATTALKPKLRLATLVLVVAAMTAAIKYFGLQERLGTLLRWVDNSSGSHQESRRCLEPDPADSRRKEAFVKLVVMDAIGCFSQMGLCT